jgi:hypothetical protein
MVRLYDRDARDIAELLDICAAYMERGGHGLASWTPSDADVFGQAIKADVDATSLSAGRARLIVAAIREQLVRGSDD